MADQVGYFDYQGGKNNRYRDSQGNVYHNHFGPALNSIGNAFGLKSGIKNWTDEQHKRLETKSKPNQPSKNNPPRVPNFGPNYKEEELAAGQKAEDYRKGAGFVGQTPSRDVQKSNGAKGTQTSPGGGGPINMTAADAARFYQSRGIGGFSSNQLPTTNTNPFSGGTIEAVPFGGQEASVTGNTLGAFTVNGQSYAALDPTGAGAQFNPQAPTIEGGAVRIGQAANPGPKATGKISSSRLSEALNDTAGMQSYMSKFGSPEQDQIRAANMAFYNASGTMEGLRAKEAVLGQMYAGGQTYMLNEDGSDFLRNKDGKNIAADKDAKRAYMSGAMNAADYRDTFKGAVMQAVTQTPTDPRQAENPTAQNPVPVSQQPTNTNFGPLIDAEQTGRMLESLKGMKGIGPFVDGPTYGEFLEGRKAR